MHILYNELFQPGTWYCFRWSMSCCKIYIIKAYFCTRLKSDCIKVKQTKISFFFHPDQINQDTWTTCLNTLSVFLSSCLLSHSFPNLFLSLLQTVWLCFDILYYSSWQPFSTATCSLCHIPGQDENKREKKRHDTLPYINKNCSFPRAVLNKKCKIFLHKSSCAIVHSFYFIKIVFTFN